MKTIINSEISAILEYERFRSKPYPNSDFHAGRVIQQENVIRNFAENLLLYDKIYVVTTSFAELVKIKDWITGNKLQEMLYAGEIHFLHIPFQWGYIQKWKKEKGFFKSSGLITAGIGNKLVYELGLPEEAIPNEKKYAGWSSFDLEEAVTYPLVEFHGMSRKKVGKFARLAAKNSTQIRSSEFLKFITEKSESELRNKEVREKLGFSEKVDVDNIPDDTTDIRRIFQLVVANQNIALALVHPESDLLVEQYYLEAISMPITNELRQLKMREQMNTLFDKVKLPVPQTLGKEIGFDKIIKIRNSREGKQFREWVHSNLDASKDIVSAYIDLLEKKPNFISRLVGIITPTLLGLATTAITKLPSQVVDPAISAVGEFKVKSYIERFMNPNPPKTFIEKLRPELKA